MRLRAPVLALLALPACLADLDIPSSALVTCTVQAPICPEGYVCDGGLGLCLPTTPATGDGAQVAGTPSITPAVAGANRRIRVELSTDHALVGAPALGIVSGAFAGTLVYESGSGTGPFVFAYETTGGEAEGVATIRGTFADAQGRVTRDATIGTVVLDYSPPIVDGIEVDEGVSDGNDLWVDTTSITLRPTLPAGGEIPATASISGDVDADTELAYAETLPVTLNAGDGVKVVQVQLADLAGNVVAVPVALRLDTALPTNAIIIDTPAPPEAFVNTDSLPVFFHSSGPTPPDFSDYVFSTNGTDWTATPTLGALVVSPVGQDATTTLWIRERDVFGNMTAIAAQGVLAIHEDSQPPSAPKVFTSIISGFLTSEAGVLLEAAQDPGGGPVVYEVSGGTYSDYTPVSDEPRVILPGARTGEITAYVVRAVDRAGNASGGVNVAVADKPLTLSPLSCGGGCFLYDYFAGSNRGVLAAVDPSPADSACAAGSGECRSHNAYLCARTAIDNFVCTTRTVLVSRTTSSIIQGISIAGSVMTFTDITNQLGQVVRAMSTGADGQLSTPDDGAIVTVGNGNCQGATPQGMYFGNSSNLDRLTFYNYGNDRSPGTADANEGSAVVLSASRVFGFNPCRLQTSDRHVLWGDDRSGDTRYYVFNAGADGKPGGGDDGGEWAVPDGDGDIPLLATGRVLVHQDTGAWLSYEAGPDLVFGNGDDTVVEYDDMPQSLSDADGDHAYAYGEGVMYDLTTRQSITINSSLGGSTLTTLSGSGAFLFASMYFGNGVPTRPASYSAAGRPMTFQTSDSSGEAPPSGLIADGLFAFMSGNPERLTLINLQRGGRFSRPPESSHIAFADLDGGYLVWRDTQSEKLMLYYAGADAIPGTADDKGPTELTPASGKYRWPRIDAGIIVYGDMTADSDGDYPGSDIVSSLKMVDLGADGWLGGGDDVVATLPTGAKGVVPDISGGKVVYFDYALDPTGLCESARGGPDPTTCTPAVRMVLTSGGAPTTIAAAGPARADLRIDGDRVVWSEYGSNWDVRLHTLGGSTVTIASTVDDERMPMLVDGRLAYYVQAPNGAPPERSGVFVRDSGTDATFDTSDDIILRKPLGFTPTSCDACGVRPGCAGCGNWDARPDWFDGEVTASGGGLMPAETPLDVGIGVGGIAITDNGVTTSTATIAAPVGQTIEDLRVHVTLTHPVPSQLDLRLVSPRGERVLLSNSLAAGPTVTATFDIQNAPALFDIFAEPLAGDWQLEIVDRVATQAGSLTSWRLEHRR